MRGKHYWTSEPGLEKNKQSRKRVNEQLHCRICGRPFYPDHGNASLTKMPDAICSTVCRNQYILNHPCKPAIATPPPTV